MPRYIDADNFRKTMTKRFGCIPCLTDYSEASRNDIPIDDALSLAPTADVVPKSEVEKLTINMNAYGLTAKRLAEENESLEIELENMRRNLGDAREGWNDSECEAERLRKALDEYEETSGLKQAKADVAREIFEEIYEDCFDQFGYINYEALAELKKKYTEGDE